MRITKFAHSCVSVEHDRTRVVLDPGIFAEAGVLDGADAVLITHEHVDHYVIDHLRTSSAPVFTIAAVADKIRAEDPEVAERVTVLAPDATVVIGGIEARAVGELHAVIHPDLPRFDNSGYLLTCGEQTVFHPGDALTGPGVPIDVLLLPVCAPWLKISEAIDFGREVAAPRNLAIHDRIYSEAGLGVVDGHLARLLANNGLGFTRIPDGAEFG